MPAPKVLFQKSYDGFEVSSDVWRDFDEAFDRRFNPPIEQLPGEFQGKLTVTITYEPSEDDPPLKADPA
jgi:hypothetical protein